LLPSISAEVLTYFTSLRATQSELPSNAEDVKSPDGAEPESSIPLDVQQAFHRFHFVYAIVNPQSKVYIGYSRDVWNRVGQHNRNVGAKATRNSGPWFPFSISCLAAEVDAVVSGIVLPIRGDKFYPSPHLTSGKVLPIVDNQMVTRLILTKLG
jgi:hypothetical protein